MASLALLACAEPVGGKAGAANTVDVNRLVDVLDLLWSEIIEAKGERPAHIRVGALRKCTRLLARQGSPAGRRCSRRRPSRSPPRTITSPT